MEAPAVVSGVPVAVGVGSSRGDRVRHLSLARRRLAAMLEDLACSAVYRTVPVGDAGDRPYLNMCCVGRTALEPGELLERLQEVESEAGRPAPGSTGRSGARTLDLDLLLFGERTVDEEGLTVPHPRMAARAFVLVPLSEVAAGWRVPGHAATVGELADRVARAGVDRVGVLADLTGEEGERG